MVITNSFHGTVFSVIYRRPFYSVYKKNGRVDNLLKFLQISEKHVSSAEEIDEITEIDYEDVHKRLAEYRESVLTRKFEMRTRQWFSILSKNQDRR